MTTISSYQSSMASTSYEDQGLDRPWGGNFVPVSTSPTTAATQPQKSKKSLRKMFSSKRVGNNNNNKSGTDYRADAATNRSGGSGRDLPPTTNNSVEEREISKFNDKGNYFFSRGEFDAALRMYSEALKMLKHPYIVMDPADGGKDTHMPQEMRRYRTARCLVNVGAVHTRRENYNHALSTLDLSLRQSKLVVPSNSSHYYRACEVMADALENIGLIHFKLEEYDQAGIMYTEGLAARRKCLSLMEKKHAIWRHRSKEVMRKYKEERNACLLETSVTLFYISLLREKQGDIAEATEKCEESILIRRDIIPNAKSDPTTLNIFSTIGRLYCHDDVRRYKEALWYFHQVHSMKCDIYGRDSLEVVSSLNSIAFIYNMIGDLNKSINISDRVIDIGTNGRGLNKETCVAYVNKADAHKHLREFEMAITSYEAALKVQEILGEDNDHVNAEVIEKLAETYLLANDIEKAVLSLERSIDVKKDSYGPDNEELAKSYSKLGEYYTRGLGYSQAIKCHTRALRIFKHHDNKENAAVEHNRIASILKISGERNKAMEHYMAALWHSREARLPSTDPIVADTIKNVAEFQKEC